MGPRRISESKVTITNSFSLRFDASTQNQIILKAVYEKQSSLQDTDIENFISEIKALSTDPKAREQLARQQKYLEGLSIVKEKYKVFGEAAHTFASGYSNFYFCERNPIGQLIIEELTN